MNDREAVIELIRAAFASNAYPGDAYLLGSTEGCEPFDEVGPFQGKRDWQSLEAEFLDAHYTALSFFSQAGFRFFLPAYLIADLQGQLLSADPQFHLTHGFSDFTVEDTRKDRTFQIKSGKTVFVNPRRFGAATFYDYARYRLSVFTREEAVAISAYLQYRLETAQTDFDRECIASALSGYWLERAGTAPTAEDLQQYLRQEQAYLAALQEGEDEA